MPEELTPLPEPGIIINAELRMVLGGYIKPQPFYAAGQMRAYALENRRAQPEPAAPAGEVVVTTRPDGTCVAVTRQDADGRILSVIWQADAAPSVAPEPVAWEGGEGWESLAWELCADENGEDACNELIWEGGPIPEPWGDRWMKYEGEAKRLIALVHKHAAHPPRAPLTDAEIVSIMESCLNDWDWKEFARAVESAVRQEQPHG